VLLSIVPSAFFAEQDLLRLRNCKSTTITQLMSTRGSMPIKEKGDWEGCPGEWITDPHSPDGKRFIASQFGWAKIQARMRDESKGKCELGLSGACPGRTEWLDVHHRRGRGGGKRDDRIWVDGMRNLLAVCRPCHSIARIELKGEVYGYSAATDQREFDLSRLPSRFRRTPKEVSR
jgi:hypothetical protein